MFIAKHIIDSGNPFDWGKTSKEYAKFRDIYPEIFYKKIVDMGLCGEGQKVLDKCAGKAEAAAADKCKFLHVDLLSKIRIFIMYFYIDTGEF